MKQYVLAHRNGINGLALETGVSLPGLRGPKDVSKVWYRLDDQIQIRIKCLSLNARDLQIVTSDYPAPHRVPEGVIPVSGEQFALGKADQRRERCRRGGWQWSNPVQGRRSGRTRFPTGS